MSWLLKQNILFNRRQQLLPLLNKYQKNLLQTTEQDTTDNNDRYNKLSNKRDEVEEEYRIQFPYSSRNKSKEDTLKIDNITLDDYSEAASKMNDFFWDNPLVKAFKIKKNDANQRVLFNMWLNHLNENLSLKSYYSSDPTNINGIIVNSPHSQLHEYTELLDLADTAETKELHNYFLALAEIVQKPKIYSEFSKILEINGFGVDKKERRHGIAKKLVSASLNLGEKRGFDRFRVDCTNCNQADALFRNHWQQVLKIPFDHFDNIDDKMNGYNIRIYEKELDTPIID